MLTGLSADGSLGEGFIVVSDPVQLVDTLGDHVMLASAYQPGDVGDHRVEISEVAGEVQLAIRDFGFIH